MRVRSVLIQTLRRASKSRETSPHFSSLPVALCCVQNIVGVSSSDNDHYTAIKKLQYKSALKWICLGRTGYGRTEALFRLLSWMTEKKHDRFKWRLSVSWTSFESRMPGYIVTTTRTRLMVPILQSSALKIEAECSSETFASLSTYALFQPRGQSIVMFRIRVKF